MCDFPFEKLVMGKIDGQTRLFTFIKSQNTVYLLNQIQKELRMHAIDLTRFQGSLVDLEYENDFFRLTTMDLVLKFKLRFVQNQVEVFAQTVLFNKFQLRIREVKEFFKYKIAQSSSGLICLQKSEIGGDFEAENEDENDFICLIKKEMNKEMMDVAIDLYL